MLGELRTSRRPRKRMSNRVIMTGRGFFGDVWNGIKSGASAVNNALKSTKAVSTIAGLIPDGRAQAIAKVAGMAGYGRKRRVGRPRKRTAMRGRGAKNVILV